MINNIPPVENIPPNYSPTGVFHNFSPKSKEEDLCRKKVDLCKVRTPFFSHSILPPPPPESNSAASTPRRIKVLNTPNFKKEFDDKAFTPILPKLGE